MLSYKIVQPSPYKVGVVPSCQVQDSQVNLFGSEVTRGSLPLILQNYFLYLNTRYSISGTESILSFEEDQQDTLNIRLLPEQKLTEKEVFAFFEHWDAFIEEEKEDRGHSISIVIEGDDVVLETYQKRLEARSKKLECEKQKINAKVKEDSKPTVLKWTGGMSTACMAAGFAVGGPVGALFGAGLGLVMGPIVGVQATSEADLSESTKERIREYGEKESFVDLLTVIPFREMVRENTVESKMISTKIEKDEPLTLEYVASKPVELPKKITC